MEEFDNRLENIKQLLSSQSRQSWLFGAGISFGSKIPLMYPLTSRVERIIEEDSGDKEKEILAALKADLSDDCHVEHYLSHLGDLLAIADRSRSQSAYIGANRYTGEELRKLYLEIIKAIGGIVRYGYVAANAEHTIEEEIGSAANPIVEIEPHCKFIKALLLSKSNLEQRSKTTFFTTNYDTLLEDALALHKKIVCDGFSGGAVGFWNAENEFSNAALDSNTYHLYKLHGSIDWHRDDDLGLVRARYGTKYLSNPANIMIYPQATKYIETQKDPFASLFLGLRKNLMSGQQNTLITCGYSFGDDHINAEIESALRSDSNQTTVIVFIKESPKNGIVINKTLDAWLKCPKINSRVYVAGELGIYHNSTTPLAEYDNSKYTWWRFDGLTQFISTGDIP
ncbi:SIR2 family protein [Serratia marcescens]|uniref:SIR2 family NAD-dependent protein deacylase n=2 Tax=Serratia marcescens TaxID=615 RepID=UPI00274F6D4E|nr:SIR2 family protein [Serratia marcescens]MDP8611076.1 SIR2 family protein [Serratia marcescens]MDP8616208.1 SIR2 family protein [Serratia marcescens]MDP8646335.1 SIR2 family protein [Serratia marcescens]MDP8656227.1 SIR2 family protein [Serratia marcescens]MDP8661211.1 SIR2 family protein [Serratia marcescens]